MLPSLTVGLLTYPLWRRIAPGRFLVADGFPKLLVSTHALGKAEPVCHRRCRLYWLGIRQVVIGILGTQILLDVARAKGVRRFVQVSTDEVMGSLHDEQAFFSEDSPFCPNSPYAASKAGAEHLVRAAHHTFGLDTVITRCGNNYGPHQFPEKFLPLTIAKALNNEPIPLYGDGPNVRDWIYVDDHCRAILQVLKNGRPGAVYNIGARNERRNIDVAKSVLDFLGKPHSLIQFVKDRPGHDRRYAIDPSLVERELGWHPRETWSSGLRQTIEWYMKNEVWVERLRSGAYRAFHGREVGAR